jgi:transcriptional regulator with XRE-family HTH domain
MKRMTFSDLYRTAEQHEDYWIAGAILAFTESVLREMERQGLTRTALAARLGATPAYVTKILRGRVNFTLATMVRISRALGTKLHVHLGGSPRRQSAPPAGDETRVTAARAGRSSKVVAGTGRLAAPARRPAALKARQRPAGKPRRAPASRARITR